MNIYIRYFLCCCVQLCIYNNLFAQLSMAKRANERNLGISGPDFKTNPPGPNFLKINKNVTGSVVREGLLLVVF